MDNVVFIFTTIAVMGMLLVYSIVQIISAGIRAERFFDELDEKEELDG